jgi:hypothetical protein
MDWHWTIIIIAAIIAVADVANTWIKSRRGPK